MTKPLIFLGQASLNLGSEVCKILGVQPQEIDTNPFADEEPYLHILHPRRIRSKKVFIIQSTPHPAAKNLLNLLILARAISECSLETILISPFTVFRRKEKKDKGKPGEAVTGQLVAELMKAVGINHIVLCDPHCPRQVRHLKNSGIQVSIIDPTEFFAQALTQEDLTNAVILSPDAGRAKATRKLAQTLQLPLLLGKKFRPGHDQVEFEGVNGSVKGLKVLIREDEINTGGTLEKTTEVLLNKMGAKKVIVVCSHLVLAGDAIRILKEISGLTKIIGTDSIYLPRPKRNLPKLTVVSLAPLIAQEIQRILQEE